MLELLEELNPGEKHIFQQHVHMHELTALSINGIKGQALVLTNHYVYLIFKGFFKRACIKINGSQLTKAEAQGDSLLVEAGGTTYKITLPAHKTALLPGIVHRLRHWQQERAPETGQKGS